MRRFTLATMAAVLMGLGISASSIAAPGGAYLQNRVRSLGACHCRGRSNPAFWKTKMAGIAVA